MIPLLLALSLLALGVAPHVWLGVPDTGAMVAAAPQPEPPYCAGWYLSGTTKDGLLVLNPIVMNRGPSTRIELWIHMSNSLPESAEGWYQITDDAPLMRPTYWMPYAISRGDHVATAEVFEEGIRVNGWQTRIQCALRVRVR